MKKITLALILLICTLHAKADSTPQWITAFENQNATNSWICFQKEFNIKVVPTRASARIAADSKYWLWINGKLVVLEGAVKRGPNPRDTYYDEVDIAPYLKSGHNVLSALVWYFGKEGFSYNPSGSGALLFDCEADEFTLKSDATWKSAMHPSYYTPLKPVPNFRLPESSIGFDARQDVAGWESGNNLACKHWAAARIVGKEGDAPWNKLHHRVIPMWKDFGLKDYVSQTIRKGDECDTLVCRLPYNAQVMPYMEVNADPGRLITILTDHYQGGSAYNVRAEYITKQGTQHYENKGWMNGENVYYVYPKDVKLSKVRFRETGYNTEFEGYFHCNDAFLNKMWDKSQRTLYVTMRDTYMDCPDRERAQWWGDEVNESGEAFYALSVSSHLLMKKGMYELIGWQRPTGEIYAPIPSSNYHTELPGQMLASIGYFGFWNYYLNTGDLQTIKDLYPGVKKYMKVWQKNADGTIKFRAGEWTWGDWGENIDIKVLFNAWYYIALQGQHNMALALGLTDEAEALAQEMKELKIAFNKVFWNGKEYRHPDYKLLTDDRIHALSVVSGLADKEKYPAILNVLKRSEHASPYMEKYVIEALFCMEQGKYGIERMKKRFAEMVNDPERSTLYEGWSIGPGGFGGGTTNHAWSGGGLTIMSQYVCGIFPTTPGYEEYRICPQPAGIKQAETLVPTVKGNIQVSFTDDAREFALNVSSPDGMKAIICLPSASKTISLNGEIIWSKGKLTTHGANTVLAADKVNSSSIAFKMNRGGNWKFVTTK